MTLKALKVGQDARTAQLKLQLMELISQYEFETGQLVNCIEFQGGDRYGTLESPLEIEVMLEDSCSEPPAFIAPAEDTLGKKLRDFDDVANEVAGMIGMEVSCG